MGLVRIKSLEVCLAADTTVSIVEVTRSLSRQRANLVIQRGNDPAIRLSIVAATLFVSDWVVKVVYFAAATGSPTRHNAHTLDTVLKVGAMLALAGWFYATARSDAITRRVPILLGLLVSAGADYVTQLHDPPFYVGILFFLAVHVLYLAGVRWRDLAKVVSRRWRVCGWMVGCAGVVALVVFFIGCPVGCQPWPNATLVVAYAVASVATILAFALLATKIHVARPTHYLAASIGVGVFFAADVLLFVDALNDKSLKCPVSKDASPLWAVIAIVLYQAGQYAFASGVANS